MYYPIKTPWLFRKIYSKYTWHVDTPEPLLYLTFDDGPHPEVTPFVLDELKKHNAKATFFCIGKNVVQYPDIYKRILDEGHRTGNHTFNHLNGWSTPDDTYINDILKAKQFIDSSLFRPPYGKITRFQAKVLMTENKTFQSMFRIIMWDILSGDFDTSKTGDDCVMNVVPNVRNGSIITFHDSEKAWSRLSVALPVVLETLTEKNYRFDALSF